MQVNNPNHNNIFVPTDNSSIYKGLPASFYDSSIFYFLGTNNGKKNVHTNGKIFDFHSVTLLPVNKQTATVPMPSYCGKQKEPFTKHIDKRIIGFALDVKDDNKTNIIEKTQIDGWSDNNNINYGGLYYGDTIQTRQNGNITVRKKKPGQTNVGFMAEDLKSYSDKNTALKRKRLNLPINAIRSRSPLYSYNNGQMIHLHNNLNTTRGLPSLRGSIRLSDGAIEFPYNEYVIKGRNINGAIDTTALILDERKIHPMSIHQQQSIANDINSYLVQTHQNAYKIDRRTKHLTLLRNLNDIKKTLATISTAY